MIKTFLNLTNESVTLVNGIVFSKKMGLLCKHIFPILGHFIKFLGRFSVTENSPFCSQKKGRYFLFFKLPLISLCHPFGDKSPHLVKLELIHVQIGCSKSKGYHSINLISLFCLFHCDQLLIKYVSLNSCIN